MTLTLSNPLRPAILAASRSARMERTISRLPASPARWSPASCPAPPSAAVAAVKDLVASGRYISVDYLGEDISHAGEAEADGRRRTCRCWQAYGDARPAPTPTGRARWRCRSSSPRWASPCRRGGARPGQRPDDLRRRRGGRRLGERRRRGPHHHRLHAADRRASCAGSSRPSPRCCRPTCTAPRPDCRELSGAGLSDPAVQGRLHASRPRWPSRARTRSTPPTCAACGS